jgi:hypothetical protein
MENIPRNFPTRNNPRLIGLVMVKMIVSSVISRGSVPMASNPQSESPQKMIQLKVKIIPMLVIWSALNKPFSTLIFPGVQPRARKKKRKAITVRM